MKKLFVKNIAICFSLSCVLTSSFACKVIGKVISVSGEATAGGRNLTRGANICEGDSIKTADKAKLSYKLNDGSYFMLPQKSEMQVKKFNYQADGKNNEVNAQLIKGKIKTRSGEIGREARHSDLAAEAGIPKSEQVNPANYKIEAGVATVGVRGTAIALALTEPKEQLGIESLFEQHNAASMTNDAPKVNVAVFSGYVEVEVIDNASGQVQAYSFGSGGDAFFGKVGENGSLDSFANETGVNPDSIDYLDSLLDLSTMILGEFVTELVPFPFNFDRLTCHKPCPIFV